MGLAPALGAVEPLDGSPPGRPSSYHLSAPRPGRSDRPASYLSVGAAADGEQQAHRLAGHGSWGAEPPVLTEPAANSAPPVRPSPLRSLRGQPVDVSVSVPFPEQPPRVIGQGAGLWMSLARSLAPVPSAFGIALAAFDQDMLAGQANVEGASRGFARPLGFVLLALGIFMAVFPLTPAFLRRSAHKSSRRLEQSTSRPAQVAPMSLRQRRQVREMWTAFCLGFVAILAMDAGVILALASERNEVGQLRFAGRLAVVISLSVGQLVSRRVLGHLQGRLHDPSLLQQTLLLLPLLLLSVDVTFASEGNRWLSYPRLGLWLGLPSAACLLDLLRMHSEAPRRLSPGKSFARAGQFALVPHSPQPRSPSPQGSAQDIGADYPGQAISTGYLGQGQAISTGYLGQGQATGTEYLAENLGHTADIGAALHARKASEETDDDSFQEGTISTWGPAASPRTSARTS